MPTAFEASPIVLYSATNCLSLLKQNTCSNCLSSVLIACYWFSSGVTHSKLSARLSKTLPFLWLTCVFLISSFGK